MLTIDEAIAHAREVAEYKRKCNENSDCIDITCERCAEEHEQLAEWLEELKAYREIGTVEECKNSVLDIQKAYNKAIDDFVKMIKERVGMDWEWDFYFIGQIAEQLKEGRNNENYNKEES